MSSPYKVNMVFIPFPIMSHLVAAVNTAKLLSDRDERLSITVLVMKLPTDTKISSFVKNSPNSRINFVELPETDPSTIAELVKSPKTLVRGFVDSQREAVKDAVATMMACPGSGRLAGFVIDMFCTPMIDVANDFRAPSYVFFTCGAAVLGMMFYLQSVLDDESRNVTEYEDLGAEIYIPTYVNRFTAAVMPDSFLDKEINFMDIPRRFRETKGIIINTFLDFESYAIASLESDEGIPPVYPVGPVLLHALGEESDQNKQKHEEIIGWLDGQPDSSVVFLCFGTTGCFEEDQVKEIALALERSGNRFLWSLRKPPPKLKIEFTGEYENPEEVLPEGFLERTLEVGKVIGWAPQMAVLSHPAVGGFVSHCGWNSTLESVWCGVPMAVWPLGAEQKANAFQLVKEFEMAVEVKMDYSKDSGVIVGADTIERAIRELMDPDNEIRVKVRTLKEKSRKVMMEGESSDNFLGRFVDNVMDNIC